MNKTILEIKEILAQYTVWNACFKLIQDQMTLKSSMVNSDKQMTTLILLWKIFFFAIFKFHTCEFRIPFISVLNCLNFVCATPFIFSYPRQTIQLIKN